VERGLVGAEGMDREGEGVPEDVVGGGRVED